MQSDARGLPLSTSDFSARDAFERGLTAFRSYRGDPIAPFDEAIAADPGFAGAYVAKALVLATLFERRFARDALAALDAGEKAIAKGTAREQALAAAARRHAEGDWAAGAAALDEVLVSYPRDILALQSAHLTDFVMGDAARLRHRVARVMPHWSQDLPGYSYVLGMYAFGLEESNLYPQAEGAGRRALELEADDCWAVHAVTHVLEMQGRIDEGIAFLEARKAQWGAPDNGFSYHNWWHLALFHMDRGDFGRALAIYDDVLAGAHAMAMSRLDGTALLWRLMLEGVDVGGRFAAIADTWEADLDREAGYYAFNDFHAALAFAATGRSAPLGQVAKALEDAAWQKGTNGEMSREVGVDVSAAAAEFAAGRYEAAVRHLLAVRDGAWRFGGSQAQRDLLTLTLIEAARRAGNTRLARHYLNERLVNKPAGAWGLRLLERIEPAAAAPARRERVA